MKDLVERKIGDLTIRIDRTLCVATSNCMKVAPEVFEFDDENICAFKANTPGNGPSDRKYSPSSLVGHQLRAADSALAAR